MNGAQADGCSPVAKAFADGVDVCRPCAAGHDRQVAGHRQPGRRALRARPRAPQRRLDRLGHRRRDPRRHPPAGRDDRHLHRDRRRRHDGGAGQARRARRHRPRRARRARHHRRGPQDARRGARARSRPSRSSRRSTSSSPRSRARRPALMAVKVKLPTQLRAAAGGESEVSVDGRDRRRRPRRALRAPRRAARPPVRRRRRPAPLRQRLRRRRGHPLRRRARHAGRRRAGGPDPPRRAGG